LCSGERKERRGERRRKKRKEMAGCLLNNLQRPYFLSQRRFVARMHCWPTMFFLAPSVDTFVFLILAKDFFDPLSD
jgi:hypothetical protein